MELWDGNSLSTSTNLIQKSNQEIPKMCTTNHWFGFLRSSSLKELNKEKRCLNGFKITKKFNLFEQPRKEYRLGGIKFRQIINAYHEFSVNKFKFISNLIKKCYAEFDER